MSNNSSSVKLSDYNSSSDEYDTEIEVEGTVLLRIKLNVSHYQLSIVPRAISF